MLKTKMIYFDYNATTPLDPEVFAAMRPYLEEHFGNPASHSHSFGWRADMAVEKARAQVAQILGAHPKEIFFTSGATEANNMAILGLFPWNEGPYHLITGATEHKAVLEVAKEVERRGHQVSVHPVDRWGQIHGRDLEQSLRPNTRLVSLMMANNEIGTLHPIAELAAVARAKGVWFHTDAAQTVGKMPTTVKDLGVDLLSLSAHKFYGPKGVGALYVRSSNPSIPITPLMFGGGQERGLRPGTLNVPGIVGLGAACERSLSLMETESRRLTKWRDQIAQVVQSQLREVVLNGHPSQRLCNNLNFSFTKPSMDPHSIGLSCFALSAGSACQSGSGQISHVLRAIGQTGQSHPLALRLSLGRFTKEEDVQQLLEALTQIPLHNQPVLGGP